MTQPIGKFWMVHGIGQGVPRYCHPSKASAQKEASRLAKVYPGVQFVVLAVVDAYVADVPTVNRVAITKPAPAPNPDDGIPF